VSSNRCRNQGSIADHCRRGRHAVLAASDYMTAKIPGARKVVIPAAGHAVNIDQPKAFTGSRPSLPQPDQALLNRLKKD